MIKIDYSQLQCYMDCPRRYYNRYVKCLKKTGYDERDVDREFGKCFHKAIEILYKENDLEKAKNVYRTEFNTIETEKAKTPVNGEKLVQAYQEYWAKPINELSDTNLETMEVEITDSFMVSPDVEYIVKIDRIAKNSAGIWIVETKTTKQIAYNYFSKFELNMQISGYCSYVKQKYGQCSGAILNVTCVGYRERAYRGEPAGFHYNFARDIVNRNEEQLEEFNKQVISWSNRLKADEDFPQNMSACHQFSGCGFKELCISCNDQEVENVLYEKYDPTEYLKEGTNDKSK